MPLRKRQEVQELLSEEGVRAAEACGTRPPGLTPSREKSEEPTSAQCLSVGVFCPNAPRFPYHAPTEWAEGGSLPISPCHDADERGTVAPRKYGAKPACGYLEMEFLRRTARVLRPDWRMRRPEQERLPRRWPNSRGHLGKVGRLRVRTHVGRAALTPPSPQAKNAEAFCFLGRGRIRGRDASAGEGGLAPEIWLPAVSTLRWQNSRRCIAVNVRSGGER